MKFVGSFSLLAEDGARSLLVSRNIVKHQWDLWINSSAQSALLSMHICCITHPYLSHSIAVVSLPSHA